MKTVLEDLAVEEASERCIKEGKQGKRALLPARSLIACDRKGAWSCPYENITWDCACQCDSGALVSLFIMEADSSPTRLSELHCLPASRTLLEPLFKYRAFCFLNPCFQEHFQLSTKILNQLAKELKCPARGQLRNLVSSSPQCTTV